MPREQPLDKVKRIATSLTRAILLIQEKEAAHLGRHIDALKRLSDIFSGVARGIEDDYVSPH